MDKYGTIYIQALNVPRRYTYLVYLYFIYKKEAAIFIMVGFFYFERRVYMNLENFKRNERLEGVFNRVAANFDSIGPKYFSYFGEKLVEYLRVN